MMAMAIPAPRDLPIAEGGHLAMERVAVGCELIFVAASTGRGGFHLPFRIADLGDLMRGVAIRANRSHIRAGFEQLPVDTRGVVPERPCMTGPASRRYVRMIGLALRVVVAQDSMRSVATGTARGDQEALPCEGGAV